MAEQNHEILRVEHLKKFFTVPNGMLHAVDDISFTIDAGKTLGVVGESGCGKSTMGRAILRLHEPTDGKVYFDQKDIRALNDKQMKDMRRDMQIIFQDPFASPRCVRAFSPKMRRTASHRHFAFAAYNFLDFRIWLSRCPSRINWQRAICSALDAVWL